MRLARWWPVVLLAVVAVGVAPWGLFWNDLPDPVATHWDLYGDADGHAARTTMFVVLTALALVFAACAVLLTLRRSRALGLVWIAYLATGLAAGVSATTVLTNRDAASWQDAHMNLLMVVGLLVPMVLLGRLGSEIADRNSEPHGADDLPRLDLRPGEVAAWSGTARAAWPWVLAAASVAGAFVLRGFGPATVAALLGLALLGALLGSVRVSVGANGLRARPGLVAWPVVRLPLSRIAHAEAIDARPLQWGGWGYRGSLHLFHRAAWFVRGGEGLRVDLTDKSVFMVTVDDAEQAAAVLNGLLER